MIKWIKSKMIWIIGIVVTLLSIETAIGSFKKNKSTKVKEASIKAIGKSENLEEPVSKVIERNKELIKTSEDILEENEALIKRIREVLNG